jgi:hypothetical protein
MRDAQVTDKVLADLIAEADQSADYCFDLFRTESGWKWKRLAAALRELQERRAGESIASSGSLEPPP